ncbi:MAG: YSC84-related protein [Candidatus Accumulibacter sp.]|uniref:lipid-binding SYLF domain-containing protein n=1 Tax=Accumulibacter sp. TaxID=2053492 RepID=UPI00287B1130|nr:YSC84-related protein [Accumulibacter sp.]MDS4015966.1 YSC84-related protein [Accumulibacter sp.]
MRRALIICLAALALFVNTPSFATESTVAQERAEIRKTSQSILRQLYRSSPAAKKRIAASAGYATFSNFGMKIFLAGGGAGSGVAVNNRTQREIFMKMVEVQAGFGIGIKKFSLVFVFDNEDALTNFVDSGWESSAQATAAATDGKQGGAFEGAVLVAPGVHVYQMTDKGLALDATLKGTKYYRNNDLN